MTDHGRIELLAFNSRPSARHAWRSNRIFGRAMCLVALLLLLLCTSTVQADALGKLKAKKLEAVHKSIESLRADWQSIPRTGPWHEYRANLHVHSHWSHDSRGKIEDIVAAAKKVGTSVLMFTEHPAEHYDFFKDGHQGMKDGVLLIPGAESQGFLCYPTLSLKGVNLGTSQEFNDLVTGRGGHMFVSHLEERMDWKIRDVTGVEIYNTHADFKDEKALAATLRNPLSIFQLAELFNKYPQESYSALQDYPADYLKRWDELCRTAPHTGVSANDAHQNVGLIVRWTKPDKVRIEDALEKTLAEIDVDVLPNSAELRQGKQVGDVLYRFQLDPYENSLKHVGTHLLLKELNEQSVREALSAGRAFVAFDWLADATGFDFAATAGDKRHDMGSQLTWSEGIKLQGQAPLPAHWRVIRNGKVVQEHDGRTIEFAPTEPGNYRAECWLDIAGERMIWILSNPIYLPPPE